MPVSGCLTVGLCQGLPDIDAHLSLKELKGAWLLSQALPSEKRVQSGLGVRKTYIERMARKEYSKTRLRASTISQCFDFITLSFSAREIVLLASLANELHPASHQVAEI